MAFMILRRKKKISNNKLERGGPSKKIIAAKLFLSKV
jgi:hypothetical protein